MPPPALTEAREEFLRAKNGIALQLDPTDVHEADVALQRAESAFSDEPDEATTTDLALIADRRALIACRTREVNSARRDRCSVRPRCSSSSSRWRPRRKRSRWWTFRPS
jgi:hypothetical protein